MNIADTNSVFNSHKPIKQHLETIILLDTYFFQVGGISSPKKNLRDHNYEKWCAYKTCAFPLSDAPLSGGTCLIFWVQYTSIFTHAHTHTHIYIYIHKLYTQICSEDAWKKHTILQIKVKLRSDLLWSNKKTSNVTNTKHIQKITVHDH